MSAGTGSAALLPKWHAPSSASPANQTRPSLSLYNSLTRKKDLFVPIREGAVGWYSCGPTVYDASHMGHARSFLTFDILRRVMENYFGYRVTYVMNITDIDDKIILRARHNYLCAELKKSTLALTTEVLERVNHAATAFINSKLVKPSPLLSAVQSIDAWPQLQATIASHSAAVEDQVGEKFSLYQTTVQRVYAAVQTARSNLANRQTDKAAVDALLDAAQDVLALQLDAEKGSTVTEHGIFRELSTHWENEFMVDMRALNIRPPTILTRVSEYVPEIVDFVAKIVDNGFAYAADGSVYFDVAAFKAANHDYAKLAPWSAGHSGLLEEGEGSLGATAGKKAKSDFALWKASKPGEPSWPSPWGPGRPGWHIECSAMAGDVLGECMDIHSGGIDLCFPHHDNELAQSEAYYGNQQWVNYFLHAGHLHIEGQKMSKSLKNFITIKEALEKYSATQIRMMMLMHSWDSVLDYKEASMQHAIAVEASFKNFFHNVKALKRAEVFNTTSPDSNAELRHNFGKQDKALLQLYYDSRERIHAALCDSINTAATITEMLELINKCNVYVSEKASLRLPPNASLLEEVAKHITGLLRTFGLVESPVDEIGYETSGAKTGANLEESVMPFVSAMSSFRDLVRDLARQGGDDLKSQLLRACDDLRDKTLPDLGVLLEDREGATSLVKLMSAAEIKQISDEKAARETQKQQQKEANRQAALQKRIERLEKGRVAPTSMFKDPNAGFSAWSESGMPTHDAEGQPLTKSRLKKLTKEFEMQVKLHQEFTDAVSSGEMK